MIGAGRNEVLSAMTNAMAVLDAELVESDAGLMAATVLATARQRCLVVLLTDLNPTAIEGAAARIPALASRHRLLIAAVADPRIDEMAAAREERRRGLRRRGGRAGQVRAGPDLRPAPPARRRGRGRPARPAAPGPRPTPT